MTTTRLSMVALLLTALVLGVGSRANSEDVAKPVGDSAQIEFFEKNIRPLLVTHCYECHSGDEDSGGLKVDSRQAMIAGGDSGSSLVPGKPRKSLILEAVRYKNHQLQMPPEGKISDREIALLEKWIAQGAVDPREATSTSAAPTGMSIEDGRKFWSFQPVRKPEVPKVQNSDWVRTPIDAFIAKRLSDEKLTPAATADRATLIRRLTFDLTGLPPTPEEIDAFVADESADAYPNLIERLLASPHYGQRWGRHWLDVARYSDSNGLDENLAFGNAWRYRDYVVDAFNNDKPFDQFLIEQIAGDLLPTASEETKTATGFLCLGAKVLAEPDREKLVMDTIDEQLDSLGKAFMGMTIGCVRCHDHKFDPIKQNDYYALAAIFKSTRSFSDTKTGAIKHWYEHSFADAAELGEIAKVDKAIKAKKKEATDFKNRVIGEMRTEARAKATEYLVASTRFSPDATLNEVKQIAEPLGLHPRILHHCRLHLHYRRDDPFFNQWDSRRNDPAAVREHFGDLFARVAANKKDESDPNVKLASAALKDNVGFLAVPPKPEFAFDQATLTEYYRLMEAARLVESNAAGRCFSDGSY